MRAWSGWSEEELHRQIAELDRMIARSADARDERTRCAVSYLRQVLRDRRDALAVLRKRRRVPERTH